MRLLQRAHYVLSWLVHLYAHSIPLSPTLPEVLVVPKSISVPLVEVSKLLQIAPVLTFADTVLWNYELINPDEPLSINNVRFRHLFSGTEDEANFYLASARAELVGVEMLRVFNEYNQLSPNAGDYAAVGKVSRDLIRLSGIINDINAVIQSVRPTCEPHVFYWQIRPWYNGSGSDGPNWKYEGVPRDEELLRSGPSAGQSSVMHALDIFLGVDHKTLQNRGPADSRHTQFMEKMRLYMPGKHRDYLAYLSSSSRPIRELAKEESILRDPFNTAVAALQKLRTEHIKIACRYIVTMAHSQPDNGCPVASTWAHLQRGGGPGEGKALGTGGNKVTPLLKHGRDATKRTALPGRS